MRSNRGRGLKRLEKVHDDEGNPFGDPVSKGVFSCDFNRGP